MHLENIILHVLNSVLVFYIALFLFKEINTAWIAALIFAIHPINTEAVAWISARTDLMAGLFSFLAFFFLLKKSYISIIASVICYLAGLLCKESAIGFLLFSSVFVLYLYQKEYKPKKVFLFITLITAATYIYLLMRYPELRFWHQPDTANKNQPLSTNMHLGWYQVGMCFKVVGFYFKKLLIPWPLNFTIVHIHKKLCLISGILISILILYFLIKKKSLICCFLLWSLCFMAPAIVVPLKKLAWTPLAERYIYISAFGIAALMAFLIFKIYYSKLHSGIKKAIFCSFALYLLSFSISTIHRSYIWQDNYRLYQDCVKKSPDFGPAHNELGIALLEKGNVEEARKEFEIADRLTKGRAYNVIAKGYILLIEQDRLDPLEMLEKYDKLIKNTKDRKDLKFLLHSAIRYVERLILEDKADKRWLYRKEVFYLNKLLSLDKIAFYYYRTGQLYLALKERKKALLYFKKAYELASENTYFKAPVLRLIQRLDPNFEPNDWKK